MNISGESLKYYNDLLLGQSSFLSLSIRNDLRELRSIDLYASAWLTNPQNRNHVLTRMIPST